MSNTTFNVVHPALSDLPDNPRALYCGDAQIELIVRALYQLVPSSMVPKVGHMNPLRNINLKQNGNMDAPHGMVAIAFMSVPGSAKALQLLGQTAVHALNQVKAILTELCCECRGYVVEATGEGLCLAAFQEPAAAVVWGLKCKEALQRAEWSPTVLQSEWGKEVSSSSGKI